MPKWMTHKEAYEAKLGDLIDTFIGEMEREPGIQERRELEAQAMEYADEYHANLAEYLKAEAEGRAEDAWDDREGRGVKYEGR